MKPRRLKSLTSDYMSANRIAECGEHLVSHCFSFDQNPEFHQDGQGKARGMELLKALAYDVPGNLYMVLTAQKLSFVRPNLPTAAHGVFFKSDELRKLNHIEFTVDIGDGLDFPVAVVDLKEFDFNVENFHFLSSLRDTYVFSDLDIEAIAKRASTWIGSFSWSKSSSFNAAAIGSSLKENDPIAFFGYSSSHNNWYEAVSISGTNNYVDNVIMPYLNEALSDCNVSVII